MIARRDCPVCGSTKRLWESFPERYPELADDRGTYALMTITIHHPVDKDQIVSSATLDACTACGCVYVFECMETP